MEKHIESKTRKSPHFEELNNILTDREMDLAHKIYTELMKQFGGDILPSEEIQVIGCIIHPLRFPIKDQRTRGLHELT
jgi:hypothetical protein